MLTFGIWCGIFIPAYGAIQSYTVDSATLHLWHLDDMVQSQAVMAATNNTFLMIAVAITAIAAANWLAPRTQQQKH